MKFAHEDIEGSRKIARPFFQDTPEAEFNTAFDTYIKAVPTTPVISQAQVDNTVKMVNLTEKTPISATYDQVVYRRSVARGREGHSGQVAWSGASTRIVLWQIAVGVLLLAGWEAVGRVSGGTWTSRPSLIAVKLAAWLQGNLYLHVATTLTEVVIGLVDRRDVRRAGRPGARPLADRGRHPAADRRRVLQRAAGRAGAAVHHVLRPRHAAEDRAGDASSCSSCCSSTRSAGASSVDHDLIAQVELMGSTRRERFQKVVAPACTAWIIGGIKTALPYALVAATTGEMLAARRGLGLSAQRCRIAVRHDIALCGAVHPDAARAGGSESGGVGRTAHAALAPCRGVISRRRSSLAGVGKRFVTRDREVEALQPIDLAIHDHEFVALVGPSGCGKSTILNLIAGLLQPSGGVVSYDGVAVERAESRRSAT